MGRARLAGRVERRRHPAGLTRRAAGRACEVVQRVAGTAAACALARERAGKQLDPALARLLLREADPVFDGLDAVGQWQSVIAAEPALALLVSGERFDAALAAVATAVDIKSPYWLGHAQAVAGLAAGAGEQLGLPEDEVRTLRGAGLVHGFGRLGVSNSIWDRSGPLARRVGARPHAPLSDRAHASPV